MSTPFAHLSSPFGDGLWDETQSLNDPWSFTPRDTPFGFEPPATSSVAAISRNIAAGGAAAPGAFTPRRSPRFSDHHLEMDLHGLPPGLAPEHVTFMSQTPRGVLPQYFPSEGYVPPQPFPEAREKHIASIETSGMYRRESQKGYVNIGFECVQPFRSFEANLKANTMVKDFKTSKNSFVFKLELPQPVDGLSVVNCTFMQDKISRKLKLCIINTPCSSNTLNFIQTCARCLHSSIFGARPGATPRALVAGGADGSPGSHCSGATWHVMQFVHHYVYFVKGRFDWNRALDFLRSDPTLTVTHRLKNENQREGAGGGQSAMIEVESKQEINGHKVFQMDVFVRTDIPGRKSVSAERVCVYETSTVFELHRLVHMRVLHLLICNAIIPPAPEPPAPPKKSPSPPRTKRARADAAPSSKRAAPPASQTGFGAKKASTPCAPTPSSIWETDLIASTPRSEEMGKWVPSPVPRPTPRR